MSSGTVIERMHVDERHRIFACAARCPRRTCVRLLCSLNVASQIPAILLGGNMQRWDGGLLGSADDTAEVVCNVCLF